MHQREFFLLGCVSWHVHLHSGQVSLSHGEQVITIIVNHSQLKIVFFNFIKCIQVALVILHFGVCQLKQQ